MNISIKITNYDRNREETDNKWRMLKNVGFHMTLQIENYFCRSLLYIFKNGRDNAPARHLATKEKIQCQEETKPSWDISHGDPGNLKHFKLFLRQSCPQTYGLNSLMNTNLKYLIKQAVVKLLNYSLTRAFICTLYVHIRTLYVYVRDSERYSAC